MTIKKTIKSEAMKFLDSLTGSSLSFGKLISSLRLCENESQSSFAKRLGLSVSHLSDIENGRKSVSPERAARFAKILRQSENQFVRLALQDILNQQGLEHILVDIKAA